MIKSKKTYRITSNVFAALRQTKLLSFLFSFILISQIGAKKIALIISIGDYPSNKELNQNWSDLSSNNDASIMYDLLIHQGFENENIWTLKDQEATAKNIRAKLKNMLEILQVGDILFIHYSGHGQQVSDINSNDSVFLTNLKQDESDGFDETLVAFNAPLETYPGYDLSEHIIDDELHFFLENARTIIGSKGQLMMILDACHSGTSTRGSSENNVTTRGSNSKCIIEGNSKTPTPNFSSRGHGFNLDFNTTQGQNKSSIAVFSGCRAEEVNREWYDPASGLQFGSLTYSFSKALQSLNAEASFKNLFEKINSLMLQKFNQAQHPELEGDNMDELIFNGSLVHTPVSYKIERILGPKILLIEGGVIAGQALGDSVMLFSKDLRKKGIITHVSVSQSTVEFPGIHGVNTSKINDFKLYTNHKTRSEEIPINLNISSRKIKEKIKNSLPNHGCTWVKNDALLTLRDTILTKGIGVIAELEHSGQKLLDLPFKQIYNENSYDTLFEIIQKGSRIQKFRHLEAVETPRALHIELNVLNELGVKKHENLTKRALLEVKEGEELKVKIINISNQPLFIDVLDIYPNNEIHKMDEAMDYDLKFNFEAILPQDSLVVRTSIFPPYGLEDFKIIASTNRLDLSPILNMGKNLSQTRGASANAEAFIDELINKSVSGFSTRGEKESKIEITNHYFQIIPNPSLN